MTDPAVWVEGPMPAACRYMTIAPWAEARERHTALGARKTARATIEVEVANGLQAVSRSAGGPITAVQRLDGSGPGSATQLWTSRYGASA
jgi:hypothetical protein